ncbi:MAG: knotted carbamoyltransferase YgeW [Pseudomonadota bacterium]|nr:knotted carbamoyltransferase YgeW [Gammaproteobacteria bacterium]MBU1558489.1 knotted carbamoyltransferase YgeW [Gammaproteobacteria bacterium]MBU1926325.1 knotted carbamoyltransferase YgeW [Gammaproteobacteria bacterium]MBU2545856.1 knotted carbamoyltransferase YgeW [Gammaproteobacteria bacterium]
MNKKLLEKIRALKNLTFDYYNSDFFLTWDRTDDEIKALVYVAECLHDLHREHRSMRVFDSGLGISIFRDNSTRTRFSFASAVNALGLGLVDLDEKKSQIAHGETESETANMISFLTETVGIRDDMYLGEGDKHQRNFSQAVQTSFEEDTLHQRPSVINLQSDIDHPTQSLADLLKLKDYFGSLENLRGKKIAMSWAYSPSYGKPLSVPQGIIALMTRMGMDVTLAYPEGYDLLPEVIDLSRKNAEQHHSKFEIVHDMKTAFKDADVVYPKSWAPFHVMERRTELLRQSDQEGLKILEQECLANNAKFKNWECDAEKMKVTKDENALYMHCLPADITGVSCKAGEVTKDVFEKYKKDTYHEASFKPFVIAAMIFLTRMQNPITTLENLCT